MRVGILNATGYAGGELVRFLAGHPDFDLVGATARSRAGDRLGDVLPWILASARPRYADILLTPELGGSFDLVVSCLPNAASAAGVAPFLDSGIPVVDVSADFRLKNLAAYEHWYGEHPAPHWISAATYGLTEFRRPDLRSTKLVANPGCHAITAELALGPAVKAGLVGPWAVIDSKTGISGAGRVAAAEYGFAALNESVNAYKVTGHRHRPEIEQELTAIGDEPTRVTFVPHLIPMTRGILVTAYAPLRERVSSAHVDAAYRDTYAEEPFVHVVDEPPMTKWVAGTNHCFVHCVVDEPNRTLVAMAATDNLGKGAAGAALQNANVMLGLHEEAGLGIPAGYP